MLLILKFFQKVLKRAVMTLSQMLEISGSIPLYVGRSRKKNKTLNILLSLYYEHDYYLALHI